MDDSANGQYFGGNRLVDGLPLVHRNEVVSHLSMMIAEEASGGITRGERITAAYFPVDSVFSVLVELGGGDCYEADTIGREGLVGGELILGADVASRSVICQVGGRFAQMPLDAFQRCLADMPSFRDAVQRALLMQWYRAQQSIACNVAHTMLERCARWALLTYDAIGRPEFPLRAEYLAMMLGVRTDAVAEPMRVLEAIGAIRYADGCVTVLADHRLREAACECYAAPADYSRRLGTARPVQREAE